MTQKGFTLIEILLVLSIIGAIFLFMRPVFNTTSNEDPLDCLQSIYQQTNNFILTSLQPQVILSGNDSIIPDMHRVSISGSTISYIQEYSGIVAGYTERNLNTHADICDIKNSTLFLSGDVQEFLIYNNNIYINSPMIDAFTGSIQLRQCFSDTDCNYISQIIIDSRTQRLYIQ